MSTQDDHKNTCWYDDKITPAKMLEGARGELFPKLEFSDHWPILKELIKLCENSETLLDIGCGAAALSELINHKYTGCDLPHIIENVSKVYAPNSNFVSFDFFEDDLSFMKEYDVVVANAFLDVLPTPVLALTKLLETASNYVIIHRQRLHANDEAPDGPKNSFVEKVPSYTGFSFSSVISLFDLEHTCKQNKFVIQYIVPWSSDSYSIMLKKTE